MSTFDASWTQRDAEARTVRRSCLPTCAAPALPSRSVLLWLNRPRQLPLPTSLLSTAGSSTAIALSWLQRQCLGHVHVSAAELAHAPGYQAGEMQHWLRICYLPCPPSDCIRSCLASCHICCAGTSWRTLAPMLHRSSIFTMISQSSELRNKHYRIRCSSGSRRNVAQ